jgi:actin-like ATPase involved in cell morphogenesis
MWMMMDPSLPPPVFRQHSEVAPPRLAAMAARPDPRFALGIDFGTSHTTAILRWPDGHVRPLLFDGSPLLPSGVHVEPDGRLLVGGDAIVASRREPGRFEPTPKRRFDQTSIRRGDTDVALPAVVAAVLDRVRDEAVRVSGAWPEELSVALTHPANWSASRRQVLAEAADLAGLPNPRLVPEPVAAATYFVEVTGGTLTPGSALVVYDLGAGTFDASVVTPTDEGYEVLAADGLEDLGGDDLDAALTEYIIGTHREADADAWDRLEKPQTAADRRHRGRLVADVRAAKETLSRAPSATVPVPVLDLDVTVSRDEFEQLVRPLLERTIRSTSAAIRTTTLAPDQIAAVLLVGGSSRIPLVATLLRDDLGASPVTVEHPELVVAEGSVQSRQNLSTEEEPRPTPARAKRAQRNLAPPADPWATAATDDELPYVPVPAAASELDSEPRSAPGTALLPMAPPALPVPSRPYGRATPVHVSSPSEHPIATPARREPPAVPDAGSSAATSGRARRGAGRSERKPGGPYLGTVVNTRSRHRWLRIGLATIGALAIGAGAALVGPRVLAGGAQPGAAAGPDTGPAGAALTGQAPGDPVSAPYLRMATPSWLPAGWVKVVDDGPDGGAIVPGEAAPRGTCTYQGPGLFRVARDPGDLAACRMRGYVRQIRVRNGAAEAQFALTRGCAALWMRTSSVGYLAMACADGAVELHELGNRAPGPASRRAAWRPGFDPGNVVMGLLAQGARLTVYVNGVKAGTVEDSSIAFGRLGVGGFAPAGGLDATVMDFRAWRAA